MVALRGTATLGAPAPGLSRVTSGLLIATAGVNALFLVGLIASDTGGDPLVNVGLALAAQWIPVSIFWIVAARSKFRHLTVILAAAGVTLSAIGDTYYSLAMDADGYLEFPSPADIGYVLFYPLMVAALVTLIRPQLTGVGRLVLLETAIATAGASVVLAVVLDPVIRSAALGDTALASAVAVAYPLFDVLLLAVIAGVAAVPTVRLGRRSWALITGLLIFAAADVVYALMDAGGNYLAGTPLDATWTVGLGLMTWWVAGISGSPVPHTPGRARTTVVPLPAVAVLVGLAVLVGGTVAELSVLTITLATLTVALGSVPIIFRQAMLGRMLAAQQEAMRRLTELDKAKTDIMATMNHEFRTPLTSINGHIELLLDGDAGELPAGAVGMLRTIERNGARLQDLIDETLTSARLEDGQSMLELEPVDVAELAAEAAARTESFATRSGVEVVLERDDAAFVIDADRAHLARAFVNLLANAIKFTPADGKVTVTVEGARPGEIVVSIRDTGIGIPADDIPRLFSRFFRASNVQSAAIPGVGLGLSIAQHIVHAHGGVITVDSAVGRGTTMTVRLPASRP